MVRSIFLLSFTYLFICLFIYLFVVFEKQLQKRYSELVVGSWLQLLFFFFLNLFKLGFIFTSSSTDNLKHASEDSYHCFGD